MVVQKTLCCAAALAVSCVFADAVSAPAAVRLPEASLAWRAAAANPATVTWIWPAGATSVTLTAQGDGVAHTATYTRTGDVQSAALPATPAVTARNEYCLNVSLNFNSENRGAIVAFVRDAAQGARVIVSTGSPQWKAAGKNAVGVLPPGMSAFDSSQGTVCAGGVSCDYSFAGISVIPVGAFTVSAVTADGADVSAALERLADVLCVVIR